MVTKKEEVKETEIKVKASVGKTTGLRFIRGFGLYLDKFRNEPGNRDLVLKAMKEEYPIKTGSIEKWLDWYKGYFNMGKIKGHEKSEKVAWIPVK